MANFVRSNAMKTVHQSTHLYLTISAAIRKLCALASLTILLLAMGACGDGATGSDKSYPEGTVRMEIELLDTGLLKGHSYADAADGWTIASLKVEAVDPRQAAWPVIEDEISGIGTSNAVESFEVTIQELPRGEQITVTTIAAFESVSGERVDRRAVDQWPP